MNRQESNLDLAQVLVQEMQELDLFEPGFRLAATEPANGLEEVRTKVLTSDKKLTALCFSGGGIRSATFCLGALQQLARLKLLSKFDYLSTVSGGGFIGSWLKAWTLRDDGSGGKLGIEGVEKCIGEATEEPNPVRLLRSYTNYLAPRFNLLSADTWTIAATYARNLVLNWLVLIPLLMLPLLAPVLYLTVQRGIVGAGYNHWWLFGVGVLLVLYGGVSLRRALPSTAKGGLTQGRFLRHCLMPLVIGAATLTVWFQQIQANPQLVRDLNFWSYCPWLSRTFSPDSLFSFSSLLGVALLFNFAAFFIGKICQILDSSFFKEGSAVYATWWKELGAMMISAVVAAGLIWSWIQVFSTIDRRSVVYASFATPAFLAALALSEVFYIGTASYFTDEMDREFWSRAGAWDLIAIVGWIAVSLVALYGPALIASLGPMAKALVLGTGAAAGGVAAKIGQSALTSAVTQARGKDSIVSKVLSKLGLSVALPVFAVILMAFLAYLSVWMLWAVGNWVSVSQTLLDILKAVRLISDLTDLMPLLVARNPAEIFASAPWWSAVIVAILLALVQDGMGRVIHVNKFSLHAAYGNRIMRAYLGASRGNDRQPNPFTGFDPQDNVRLAEFAAAEVKRPLHVINIALNLVHGRNLAWQERKAASFTASAFHCGGYDVGYRPTEKYGGGQGMSLGTAVTISGAAFTPNAGYHSSPLLTFVMAFFNVRLGWWLGNPRFDTAKEPGPTHAAAPLIAETFGLTDDDHKWIYLSDGGHFDNLGVYEMVARRVRRIVVIDAGADPKYEFEDLGNAIRKIRADFCIPIERDGPMKIAHRFEGGAYCATFRIRYSEVHKIGNVPAEDIDGELLYIKPVLNNSEPQDVAQYATTSEDFPHESTSDQFFTESQFESYRMLGMHEMTTIAVGRDSSAASVAELIERGRMHWKAAKPE